MQQKSGSVEVIIALGVTGADVNDKDKYGVTPTHCAAFKGCAKVMKYLLRQEGIEFGAGNKFGLTSSRNGAIFSGCRCRRK